MDDDSRVILEKYNNIRGKTQMNESSSTSVTEILKKYPVKNKIWTFHPESSTFTAEMSELQGRGGVHDPWNRPIPQGIVKPFCDADNDITHWTVTGTTVDHQPVNLIIYND